MVKPWTLPSQSLPAKAFCFPDGDFCDILSQTTVLFDNLGKTNYLNKGLPDPMHCRETIFVKNLNNSCEY